MIRKKYRLGRCRIQLAPKGRWYEAYKIGECKMTKAAARRRAKTLGLPVRDVPHGTWCMVVTAKWGFRLVPAVQLKK